MPFKKRYYFHKIFWLIAVVVFSLLFVLTSILELFSLRNQEEKIQVELYNRASGIVSRLDQEITSYVYFADQLAGKSWVKYYMSDSEILSSQITPYQKAGIPGEVGLYGALLSHSESLAVLFPAKDQAVCGTGWMGIGSYLFALDIAADQRQSIMEAIASPDTGCVIGVHRENSDLYNSGLLFLHRMESTSKVRAKLAMFISDRNLMALFSEDEWALLEEVSFSYNGEVIYRLSGDGQGNTSSSYSAPIPAANLQCEMILRTHNSNAALTVLVGITIFVASLLLAAGISLILSIKLYSPIKNLMADIGLENENIENESQEISRLFSRLMQANQTNELQLQKYLLFARTHYLQRLLWGECDRETMRERLNEYSIPFNDDLYFAVLLVHMGEKSIVKRADMVGRVQEQLEALDIPSEWIENHESECFAIVYHKEYNALEGKLKKLEENFSAFEDEGDSVDILFSECAKGLGKLPQLYNEVTMEYSLRSNVLANLERRKQFFLPSEYQETLAHDVHAGNLRSVENTLSLLKAENLRIYQSATSLRYLSVYLLNSCRQLGEEISIESEEMDKIIEQAVMSADGNECFQAVSQVFALLCQERKKRYDQLVPEVARGIREYTEAHFCEYNLSQQAVAAHFQLTASSLSKLFKGAYGVNYLDYLRSLRIDRAKAMMKEGERDLQKIARAVGYESDLTFKRAFQKCELVSPHTYLQKGQE